MAYKGKFRFAVGELVWIRKETIGGKVVKRYHRKGIEDAYEVSINGRVYNFDDHELDVHPWFAERI